MGNDHVLSIIDEFESSSLLSNYRSCHLQCRICHEEEEYEGSNTLEVPCACSGTVKFAHRDCIQRWCNEKGSTICEICLQNYEAGYTVPEKKKAQHIDIIFTVDIPGREHAIENLRMFNIDQGELVNTTYSQNLSLTSTTQSFLRQVALILTGLLILGQFYDLVSEGAEKYAFSHLTVLLLKISGIVVPMYMVMRGLSAIQNSIKKYQRLYRRRDEDNDDDGILNMSNEYDDERRQDRGV